MRRYQLRPDRLEQFGKAGAGFGELLALQLVLREKVGVTVAEVQRPVLMAM